MSTHFNGVGGAPGIAIGRAFCLRAAPIPDPAAPEDASPDAALERFAAAQTAAAARLNAVAEDQRENGFEQEAGIFEFQAMLVEDPSLTDEVTRLVREEGQPLQAALNAAIGLVRASIAAIDDEYLRERAADVDAVGQEIRRALSGGESALANVPAGAIIVAPDLTPAETAELRGGTVAGFATAYGGPTGHTAILARALGIPAVVGLGAAALDIDDGTELILDGIGMLLIADPDAQARADYTAPCRRTARRRPSAGNHCATCPANWPTAIRSRCGPTSATRMQAQSGAGAGCRRDRAVSAPSFYFLTAAQRQAKRNNTSPIVRRSKLWPVGP